MIGNSVKLLCLLLSYCGFSPLCFGASVIVYNDSPYPLNTTILSASGQQLKTVHILPQKKFEWDADSPLNTNQSQTPYTVLFQCQMGEHFGTCKNVGPGAWVTASSATGGQGFCRMREGKFGDSHQKG